MAKKNEYFEKFILTPQKSLDEKPVRGQFYGEQPDKTYKEREMMVSISNPRISNKEEGEKRLEQLEVMKMNQLRKQYELYQTLLQDVLSTNEKYLDIVSNKYICRNEKILDALEPIIVNTIAAYSEEICEALIDELITENVINLVLLLNYPRCLC